MGAYEQDWASASASVPPPPAQAAPLDLPFGGVQVQQQAQLPLGGMPAALAGSGGAQALGDTTASLAYQGAAALAGMPGIAGLGGVPVPGQYISPAIIYAAIAVIQGVGGTVLLP